MSTSGDEAGGLRAVIVDDEPSAREVLRVFIEREPGIEIVGEATNGDQAVDRVRELSPDLLFLDVQMPERDGFGVLEALGNDVPRGVVFVTAHDEYALRAFEVHALDYLLKPFGYPRFHEAVSRITRRLEAEAALETRRTLETLIAGQRGRGGEAAVLVEREKPPAGDALPARLGVRRGSRTIIVQVEDIDWIEAADDYSRIHVGGDSHLVATRMRDFDRGLPRTFHRVHRSAIVNLARVGELRRDAGGGGVAILEGGVRLRVSRSRWEELEAALGL